MSDDPCVYIVTSGDIDSYGIDHVFATEELAETYAACERDRDVEVYQVHSSLPEPISYLRLSCTIGGKPVAVLREMERIETLFPGIDSTRGREPFERTQEVRLYNASGPAYAHVWLLVQGTDVERVRAFYASQKVEILAGFHELVAPEIERATRG